MFGECTVELKKIETLVQNCWLIS